MRITLTEKNLRTGATRLSHFETLDDAITEAKGFYGVDLTEGDAQVGNWEYSISSTEV